MIILSVLYICILILVIREIIIQNNKLEQDMYDYIKHNIDIANEVTEELDNYTITKQ